MSPNKEVDVTRLWAIRGQVVHGHGRGGTQLGFPTANVGLTKEISERLMAFDNWVYYGWGLVEPTQESGQAELIPVVMSVGFNPHFKDKALTLEVHFLKKFEEDFYGSTVRVVSCGALREQASYSGLEALIEAIKQDCRVAHEKLALGDGQKVKSCTFLTNTLGEEVPCFKLLGPLSSL